MAIENKMEGMGRRAEGYVESGYGRVANDLGAEIKGEMKKVIGLAQQKFGDVQETMHESVESASNRIAAKPLQSLLVAFGAGFLFSRLL